MYLRRIWGTYLVGALLVTLALAGCVPLGGASGAGSSETTVSAISGGEGMATIYLAGGCFWGVEKLMDSIEGVTDVQSGYANGITESPTYQDVITGRSGHAETVLVVYDPQVAPLPFLLEWFYKGIDPTSLNRQGNDAGTQYRSGVYYDDPADREVIERSLAELQEQYEERLVVENAPLDSFTPAEEYHQDYLEKNPGGYCHIDYRLFEEAAEASPEPRHFE